MDWVAFAPYGYFFLTAAMVFFLYGYIVHLYRSEKKGERNYEQYGKIALDDEYTSKPVEENEKRKSQEEG